MSTTLADSRTQVRSLDVDGHEMAPVQFWEEIFGPAAGRTAVLLEDVAKAMGTDQLYCPDLKADDVPITPETVWSIRGNRAPSAINLGRRVQVLDIMGIDKQLIFPTFALMANIMATADEGFIYNKWRISLPLPEVRALGRQGIDEYNSWAVNLTALAPERLRPVGFVVDDGTPENLLAQTKDLVRRGIRAISLPGGTPPGGVSPANPELDLYWQFLQDNNIPALLHVGGELGFMKSGEWGNAPAFKPGRIDSAEIGIEPFSFAVMHLPCSNYLTAMVLGGVFERFPRLRFGVIELGCSWFGSFAEGLDMWASNVFHKRLSKFISMPPSAYLARNVRVTPFNGFERVDLQFERYPHLSDCYCYSSDYPHFEGGLDSALVLRQRLSTLSPDTLDKYFHRNARWLLP